MIANIYIITSKYVLQFICKLHVMVIPGYIYEYFNMYFIAIMSLSHKNSCWKYQADPGNRVSMLSEFIFEGEQDQF